MREDQLYNQLRFNLQQPYDTNRLSVRHSKPKLVTIERAGGVAPVLKETIDKEDDVLNEGFSSLNLSKLKEAQFLAKRELKKQKNSLLMGPSPKFGAKGSPYQKNTTAHKPTQALKVKVSPTKKSHHLIGASNSPPVRDVSNSKTKTYNKRSTQRSLTPKKTKASATNIPTSRGAYSNGILQEKLETDKQALSVPDVHKMAMLQLLQVQNDNLQPPGIKTSNRVQTSTSAKTNKQRSSPARQRSSPARQRSSPGHQRSSPGRQKSSPGGGVKFIRPTARADVARRRREGVYKQPLTRPFQQGSRLHPRAKVRVLPRHPTLPQYDPDYNYVDPEAHLNDSAFELRQSQPQRSQDLPNADEFLNRITEARRANEAAERYAVNPARFLDDVEKEARQRLEPLLKQAEALSADIKRGVNSRNRTTVCTISPQYNGGHDSIDMSADNLLHHPIESQQSKEASASSSRAIAGAVDVPTNNLVNDRGSNYSILPDDRKILQSMLDRLDEMQKEHIEIRHRWLTVSTKYEDAGLVHLDEGEFLEEDNAGTGGHVFEPPRPMLLKNPQVATFTRSSVSRTSGLGFTQSAHKATTNLQRHQQIIYPQLAISLPEKKIKPIQDGKKRFEKHLDNIGQTSSKGFDPWLFAKQTADEILESCITQVSRELLDAGDGIVQRLYSDEFIIAERDTDNELGMLLT